MLSTIKIVGKEKDGFLSIQRRYVIKLTPLQSSVTTQEVHALQAIGRQKVSIRNCRQKLADVRNASVLYNSLKRSLVSCHEAFLFFK